MVAPFVPLVEQIDGVELEKVTVRPELLVAATVIGGPPITRFPNDAKLMVWGPGGGGTGVGACWICPVADADRANVIPPMISLNVPRTVTVTLPPGTGHGVGLHGGDIVTSLAVTWTNPLAVSLMAWHTTWLGWLASGAAGSVGSHRLFQDPGCWTAQRVPSRAESAIVTWE
jgi:hypothetical protein